MFSWDEIQGTLGTNTKPLVIWMWSKNGEKSKSHCNSWEILLENLSKTHQIGPECTQKHSYVQYACSEHNSNMFCRRLEHILDFGGPKSKLV